MISNISEKYFTAATQPDTSAARKYRQELYNALNFDAFEQIPSDFYLRFQKWYKSYPQICKVILCYLYHIDVSKHKDYELHHIIPQNVKPQGIIDLIAQALNLGIHAKSKVMQNIAILLPLLKEHNNKISDQISPRMQEWFEAYEGGSSMEEIIDYIRLSGNGNEAPVELLQILYNLQILLEAMPSMAAMSQLQYAKIEEVRALWEVSKLPNSYALFDGRLSAHTERLEDLCHLKELLDIMDDALAGGEKIRIHKTHELYTMAHLLHSGQIMRAPRGEDYREFAKWTSQAFFEVESEIITINTNHPDFKAAHKGLKKATNQLARQTSRMMLDPSNALSDKEFHMIEDAGPSDYLSPIAAE